METNRVFLLPNELCVSDEPVVIATLLGSCVAVCLFNKKMGVGGMNHFMMAKVLPGETPTTKFGDYATETLIKMMLSYDSNPQNMTAMMVGGGNVVGHLNFGLQIGGRNIEVAEEVLKKYQIHVARRDVGGNVGRKVYFESWTGRLDIEAMEKSVMSQRVEEKAKGLIAQKIRLLIVDDSSTVRSIIREAVSRDPLIEVVAEAADPFEAREALLAFDPDVISLDIIMPKMDGLTFLKKLFLYRPTPVVIVSSIAQMGSKQREQAKKIGAIGVIDKAELDMYAHPERAGEILSAEIRKAAAASVRKKTQQQLDAI